jgi:hypothetical protein
MTPIETSRRNRIPPAHATSTRPWGMGAPKKASSSATNGIANSVAVDTIEVAAMVAPAVPIRTPLAASMRNCRAAPMAAPPGTAFVTAAPAIWDVAAVNQSVWGSATRISHHMQANAPASKPSITTNQGHEIDRSSVQASKTSRSLGSSR